MANVSSSSIRSSSVHAGAWEAVNIFNFESIVNYNPQLRAVFLISSMQKPKKQRESLSTIDQCHTVWEKQNSISIGPEAHLEIKR
eukprot:1958241-Pleurochrysis_carterae.AAC.2